MDMKAIITSFLTHPRTLKTSQNRHIYEVISTTSPPASLIKNPKLNCRMNTGHIDNIKHSPKSYDYQLSNASKNIKNEPEQINIQGA